MYCESISTQNTSNETRQKILDIIKSLENTNQRSVNKYLSVLVLQNKQIRQQIIEQLDIKEIRACIPSLKRKREMNFQKWIMFLKHNGFNVLTDIVNFIITHKDNPFSALENIWTEQGDHRSLARYIITHKNDIEKICKQQNQGIGLQSLLIKEMEIKNKISRYIRQRHKKREKRNNTKSNNIPFVFIRTKGGRIAVSYILEKYVDKQKEKRAMKKINTIMYNIHTNSNQDKIETMTQQYTSGLDLIKNLSYSMLTRGKYNISRTAIQALIQNFNKGPAKLKPKNFTIKYKILLAQALGYNIPQEIANKIHQANKQSSDNIINVILQCGRGKYTAYYIRNMYDQINKELSYLGEKSLNILATKYAIQRHETINTRTMQTKEGKILLMLFSGKMIDPKNDKKTFNATIKEFRKTIDQIKKNKKPIG